MREDGGIERRQVLRGVGSAGVDVGLTGAVSGTGSIGGTTVGTQSAGAGVGVAGECGAGSVLDEETREITENGEQVHYLERQTDYDCLVTVEFDPGPLDLLAFLTLDGREPTESDYDRVANEVGGETFVIDGTTLDPGDELGLLVVGLDVPGDSGEYLTVLNEQTTEPVEPAANMSVVTGDPTVDEPVECDGSESFSRRGTIGSMAWSYERELGGDSGSGTGETFSFTPEETGQYRITLDVTDEFGRSDSAETYVDVSSGGGGFCFITTATARDDAALDSLRRFRDGSMGTTPVGRGLVGLYHRVGPPIARAMDRHPEGRTARLCRWYVARCARLSDRKRDLDSPVGRALLGVTIATIYVLGLLIAAAMYTGIRIFELCS